MAIVTYLGPVPLAPYGYPVATQGWTDWIGQGWINAQTVDFFFGSFGELLIDRQDATQLIPYYFSSFDNFMIHLEGPTLSMDSHQFSSDGLPVSGTLTGLTIYDRQGDILVFHEDEGPENIWVEEFTPDDGMDDGSGWDGQPAVRVDGLNVDMATILAATDILAALEAALSGGNDSVVGSVAAEVLTGGAGDDTITGNGGTDTLLGGSGDDALTGGDAADVLNGGGNNDTLNGGAGADTLQGGNGRDTVDYTAETAALVIDMVTNTNTGGMAAGDVLLSVEDVLGGAGNDTLTGDGASNLLVGNLGRDLLDGGAGAVRDVLLGGAQHDTLIGRDGDDILNGGGGHDSLEGGGGADILIGGTLNDTLSGGAGADLFVFQTGWGADVITDWEAGIDRARVVSGFSQSDVTLSQQGADVLLTLTPTGDTILFQNTALADVDLVGDFVFV